MDAIQKWIGEGMTDVEDCGGDTRRGIGGVAASQIAVVAFVLVRVRYMVLQHLRYSCF